ncbi:hypothetical protein [Citrobacter amalonaticus]|uniref:hypothetical protein n=1 Tax=Citrobacter amalonaticus TaxID=35703 RepID=UPI00300C9F83
MKMLFLNYTKAATGGLALLVATSALATPEDIAVKTVSVPAWNIITDTLVNMTPLVNGQRNDFVMAQICGLARGDKSQQEVNALLLKNNVDPAKLPKQGNTLSLLVNGDRGQQQTACVAYLASSLFMPVNNAVYLQDAKAPADESTKGKDKEKPSAASDKKVDADTKNATAKAAAPAKIFNQAQFAQDARVRIAMSQATAQLYAVLASNLSAEKGKSWGEYQVQAQQIIANYAPEYLRTVTIFSNATANQPIVIRSVTGNTFSVADAHNHELVQDSSNVLFRSRGVNWLGNGQIFGKEYFVDVKIIDSQPLPKKTDKKLRRKI